MSAMDVFVVAMVAPFVAALLWQICRELRSTAPIIRPAMPTVTLVLREPAQVTHDPPKCEPLCK
jgi:hypothetical protein